MTQMTSTPENAIEEFEFSRTFDAPRDLVFRVWTERDHLKRWWGPKGFTVEQCTVDLRPGGLFHYCLRSPEGEEMWGKFVYEDISRPERLVFLSSFSDAVGNTVRAFFSEEWPLEILSTVTFVAGDGKTTVIGKAHPVNATKAEEAMFNGFFASMNEGWTGTLDQLGDYLAQV